MLYLAEEASVNSSKSHDTAAGTETEPSSLYPQPTIVGPAQEPMQRPAPVCPTAGIKY